MNIKLIVIEVAALAASAAFGMRYILFTPPDHALKMAGIVEVQEVHLGSKIGGRVKSVPVQEGELVAAGEPIVVLDAPELQAKRDQFEAQLCAAKAGHERLENGARKEDIASARAALNFAEAHLAKLMAGWRPEEIESARADLESIEADVAHAQADWKRQHELRERKVASQADWDAAYAKLRRLQAQARSARAHVAMLNKGTRAEEITEAQAERDRAQAQLDVLQAGSRGEDKAEAQARVAEIEAKLAELDVQIAEAVLRAPGLVRVDVISVHPGDLVQPNQQAVRVLDPRQLWVRAYVAETDLGRIQLNQRVQVTVDSHPGQKFPGRIIQIAEQSEFTPRNVATINERRFQMFSVKVLVEETVPDSAASKQKPRLAGILKSGMAAEVQVPLEVK